MGEGVTTVAWRDVELGRELRTGAASSVREARSHGAPLLVTLTAVHSPPVARETYELPFAGIAPLVWLGRPEGLAFDDALVEAVPEGAVPATTHGVISELGVAAIGARVAEVVAIVHDAGVVLDGIQPDLIYLGRLQAFAALAPRGPRFIASAKRSVSGPGAYAVPYLGHECLTLGKSPGPPADVFALCASLFVLATGRHPFGALDDLGEIMQRMLVGAGESLPGRLGELLAMGLVADPLARPTMRELGAGLDALASALALERIPWWGLLVEGSLKQCSAELRHLMRDHYGAYEYAIVPGDGWVGFFSFQKKAFVDDHMVEALRANGREVVVLDLGDEAEHPPGWNARALCAARGVTMPGAD